VGVGVGVGSRRRCSCGEYANVINVLLVLPPVRVELLAATFAAQVTPPLASTFTWWLMNGFSSLPSVELTSGFWIFNRAWHGWREGLRIADGWQPDQPSRQPPSHTLRRGGLWSAASGPGLSDFVSFVAFCKKSFCAPRASRLRLRQTASSPRRIRVAAATGRGRCARLYAG